MSQPGGRALSVEVLQAKHVGTGHSDITKHEWVTNQHRDTLASHVGSHDHLLFLAVGQNMSTGRVKADALEKMLQPCGPPPKKAEGEELE